MPLINKQESRMGNTDGNPLYVVYNISNCSFNTETQKQVGSLDGAYNYRLAFGNGGVFAFFSQIRWVL
jgi:hypothetical protein